ncbi:hypothetical protein HK102_012433 [Quaeritorhiza haematococci]|nr:hypothetical protein HK102_012433 [Quaeritorhiza haematococci]
MELSMNFNNVGDGTNMGEAEGAAPAAGPAHHQLHIQQVLQPPPKKKIKRGPVVTKLRRVQSVPTDELGRPVLPLQIGILTVHNLGTVVYDRDTYHNERYIYPVGYMISRQYFSMNDPNKTVMYTCSISDGGDGPRFHIIAEDAPDKPIVGFSATGAWTSVIRVANAIRKREHSNSASGPDYFGFSQPTVAKLIQDLPNAHKCKNYVWQEFEVIRGRGTKKVHTKLDNPSLFTTENGDGLPVSVAIAAAAAAAPPIMPRPITFVEEKPGKSPVSGEAREDDNSNAKESAVGDFPHRDHSCTVTGADLGGGGCEVGGLRASDAVEKVNDYEEVDVVSMDEDEDQENVNSHEQENDNGHEELSESSV